MLRRSNLRIRLNQLLFNSKSNSNRNKEVPVKIHIIHSHQRNKSMMIYNQKMDKWKSVAMAIIVCPHKNGEALITIII